MSNNETLAVFPKRYFSFEEIEELNRTPSSDICDANLLFKTISTYMREDTLRTATAEKYIGEQKGYESDYPFNAFFEVYDYYKYYYEVSELNYKQFSYDVLLQALNNEDETYNVLILPGVPHTSLHLELKPDFRHQAMRNHRIVEQYIDIKKVMEHYVIS